MRTTYGPLHQSEGMTLVELMVAIAITAVVMTLSLSIFFAQYKGYRNRQSTADIQETAPTALEILRNDLMSAGWSVKQSMAFYFRDGGSGGSDEIFINDPSLVNVNMPVGRGLIMGSSCPACIVLGAGNVANTVDMNTDGVIDFVGGFSQYVLSDSTLTSFAMVTAVNGNTLTLQNPVTLANLNLNAGDNITPAMHYLVAQDTDGTQSLLRNDRNSGGDQPLAENIVDLQVSYRDQGGNWWGITGCNLNCQKTPFQAETINLFHITLVTRGTSRDMTRINDPVYCRPAVENRLAAAVGSAECGYSYRTYQTVVRPRNFGSDLQ